MEYLDIKLIAIIGGIVGIVASIGTMVLIYCLRHRISGVLISKTRVEVYTNDVPVWSKIVDKIERIDSGTAKSIRKGTVRLRILDLDKYGMSAEVVVVNHEAKQPLICATYENHHTRALVIDDGDPYIEDKAHDIFEAVRVFRSQFPELTEKFTRNYACRWMKHVLLPNTQRACIEKIAYYQNQLKRSDISVTVKEIIKGCLEKNQGYIEKIKELLARPDIQDSSGIIKPK